MLSDSHHASVDSPGEDLTARYYRGHHASGSRYGFTYGGVDRLRWFTARIGAGERILDIGCRDGTLTQRYLDGNDVVGIDIDAEALARAEAQHGIVGHQVNLNNAPIPAADESFDVVVAGEVLEHLQFPTAVVAEIRRVLRPGGRFLGSVPNAFRLRNRLTFLLGRDFETDPTHLHYFSPDMLRELLGQFRDLELGYAGGRFVAIHPRLMGSQLFWACRK